MVRIRMNSQLITQIEKSLISFFLNTYVFRRFQRRTCSLFMSTVYPFKVCVHVCVSSRNLPCLWVFWWGKNVVGILAVWMPLPFVHHCRAIIPFVYSCSLSLSFIIGYCFLVLIILFVTEDNPSFAQTFVAFDVSAIIMFIFIVLVHLWIHDRLSVCLSLPFSLLSPRCLPVVFTEELPPTLPSQPPHQVFILYWG